MVSFDNPTLARQINWLTVVGYNALVFRVKSCNQIKIVLAATQGNTEASVNLSVEARCHEYVTYNLVSATYYWFGCWVMPLQIWLVMVNRLLMLAAVACITTAIWHCRKTFSQWQRSFHWKLCCNWLKGLQQRHIAVVIQGPGPHRSYKLRPVPCTVTVSCHSIAPYVTFNNNSRTKYELCANFLVYPSQVEAWQQNVNNT